MFPRGKKRGVFLTVGIVLLVIGWFVTEGLLSLGTSLGLSIMGELPRAWTNGMRMIVISPMSGLVSLA